MTALLLSITAIIAYAFGNLRTQIIVSRFILHRNLYNYKLDNAGFTRFWSDFHWKGLLSLIGVEFLRVGLPVIIGSVLLGVVEQSEIGRAFAVFCVLLGTVFPILYNFQGEKGRISVLVGSFFLSFEIGILSVIVVLIIYYSTRYITACAMGAALFLWILSIVVIDVPLVHTLCFCSFLLLLIAYRRDIVRLIKGREHKFYFKKDLSFKFDEKY